MSQRFITALKLLLISAVGLWIYSPVFHGAWLWDDSLEVTGNNAIKTPLSGIIRIWVAPEGADYFPLKTTLQWFEWHAFGTNPCGYHLVSIILHIISALLIWKILARLGFAYGWLAGLIFVVHPVNVDSVAWISELKNTLSLPLLLLTWDSFIDEDIAKKRHIRSLIYFCLALLAKSSVVMFPVTAVLYLAWKRRTFKIQNLTALLPYFTASAAISLVAIYFQHARAISGADLQIGTWLERSFNTPLSLWFYLKQAFLPRDISSIYPRWALSLSTPYALMALTGLILSVGLTIIFRKQLGRGFFLLISCFVLNLIPALGVIPMSYLSYSWVSDHFAYISLVFSSIILCLVWIKLTEFIHIRSKPSYYAIQLLGFILLGSVAVMSYSEAARYANPEIFWTYNLSKNPDSWVVHYNYAEVISLDSSRHSEAIEHYKRSIELNSNDPEAHNNLGILLGQNYETRLNSIHEFEEAIRLRPDYAEAHNDLAAILSQDPSQIENAISHYRYALKAKPDLAQAHNNLANLLKKQGLYSEAFTHYEQALKLNPRYAEAENNLANMLVQQGGHDEEAISHYKSAAKLAPNLPTIHFNLGLLLGRIPGRQAEAIYEFQIVLSLIPNYQPAIEQIERLRQ